MPPPYSEGVAGIGGSGGLQVDLAQLLTSIGGVPAAVVRQIMALGDPSNPAGVANVLSGSPAGSEFALASMIVYSAQLSRISDALADIKAEIQNLVRSSGGMPITEVEKG